MKTLFHILLTVLLMVPSFYSFECFHECDPKVGCKDSFCGACTHVKLEEPTWICLVPLEISIITKWFLAYSNATIIEEPDDD